MFVLCIYGENKICLNKKNKKILDLCFFSVELVVTKLDHWVPGTEISPRYDNWPAVEQYTVRMYYT